MYQKRNTLCPLKKAAFLRPFLPLSSIFISPHTKPSKKRLFSYIYMYRTLAYPKFFRRLSDRCIRGNDIICDLDRTLFDIIFQIKPLEDTVFTMYAKTGLNMQYCPHIEFTPLSIPFGLILLPRKLHLSGLGLIKHQH